MEENNKEIENLAKDLKLFTEQLIKKKETYKGIATVLICLLMVQIALIFMTFSRC